MDALYKYNLCRLCLCRGDNLVNIYEENGKRDFMIADTIHDLLQFKAVKVSGVPWLACESCLDKLSDFRLFKLRSFECKIAFEARVVTASQDKAKADGCEEPCLEDPLGDYCDVMNGEESNLMDTEVISDSDEDTDVDGEVAEGKNENGSLSGNSFDDEIELLEMELLAMERRADASKNVSKNETNADMDDIGVDEGDTIHPRKRREITLRSKMDIVLKYEWGQSLTSIAREYGYPVSTVSSILKSVAKVKQQVSRSAELKATMVHKQREKAVLEMDNLLKEMHNVAKGDKIKRRRATISLEEKMEIIGLFEQGQRPSAIARELGHPVSTVGTIIKDRSRIKVHAASLAPMKSMVLTKRRTGAIYAMELLLIDWIKEQVASKLPLSLKMIQEKAKSLYDCVKGKYGMANDKFVASNGWFILFRHRARLMEFM